MKRQRKVMYACLMLNVLCIVDVYNNYTVIWATDVMYERVFFGIT